MPQLHKFTEGSTAFVPRIGNMAVSILSDRPYIDEFGMTCVTITAPDGVGVAGDFPVMWLAPTMAPTIDRRDYMAEAGLNADDDPALL